MALFLPSHHPLAFLYSFHPQVRGARFNDFNWTFVSENLVFSLGMSFLWTCLSSLWEWDGRKEMTWLASGPGQRHPSQGVAVWPGLPKNHMLCGHNESFSVGPGLREAFNCADLWSLLKYYAPQYDWCSMWPAFKIWVSEKEKSKLLQAWKRKVFLFFPILAHL